MARMTQKEQYRAYIEQWRRAGPELERFCAEEMRNYRYNPKDADTLLDLGDHYDGPPRLTSGLIEMQDIFMKSAKKRGLAVDTVRKSGTAYGGYGTLRMRGDRDLLDRPLMALFCSVRCPGHLVNETYDLAQRFRREGVPVIGGFHSPMEKECLRILLRSPHPVVWCLARGLFRKVPSSPIDCRPATNEGRLLMVSPFPDGVRRATAKTAIIRNRFVIHHAAAVFVAYAAKSGKTEALCREILATGKPLYTFDDPVHAEILRAGARNIRTADLQRLDR